MKARWLKSAKTKGDKDILRRRVREANDVLTVLKGMLQEDLTSSVKGMANPTHFDNPNWDTKVAYQLGEQHALQTIIELLKLEDK